jgi:hypothetical protein
MIKLAAAVALIAGLFIVALSAVQAAPPSTTIILSCDRAVGSATAVVQLQESLFGANVGDPITVSCGPDSISGLKTERIKVPLNAGAVNVSTFFVETATFSGGCLGGGSLTFKSTCPDTGAAATLTVR